MTDRPIIFSAPMVKALLAGRKTMTRRLATSPLAKCQVGDRLWVREAFGGPVLTVVNGTLVDQILYRATDDGWRDQKGKPLEKWRSPIHMPRWASRITLTVTGVRKERLQKITEDDALAEGVDRFNSGGDGMFGIAVPDGYEHAGLSARETFGSLWCALHGPSAWRDNPEVVALTFAVALKNIDAEDKA